MHRTNILKFMSYSLFLEKQKQTKEYKKNYITSTNIALPYMESVLIKMGFLYNQNIYDIDVEEVQKTYRYLDNIGYCYLNNIQPYPLVQVDKIPNFYKTLQLYPNISKCIGSPDGNIKIVYDLDILFPLIFGSYKCWSYNNFENFIREIYNLIKIVDENHKLLDHYTNEYDDYEELFNNFNMISSPYDKKLIEEKYSKYEKMRNELLLRNNSY